MTYKKGDLVLIRYRYGTDFGYDEADTVKGYIEFMAEITDVVGEGREIYFYCVKPYSDCISENDGSSFVYKKSILMNIIYPSEIVRLATPEEYMLEMI